MRLSLLILLFALGLIGANVLTHLGIPYGPVFLVALGGLGWLAIDFVKSNRATKAKIASIHKA